MIFGDRFILDIIYILLLFASIFLAIILYTRFNHLINRRWKNNQRNLVQTLLAKYVNAPSASEAMKIKKRLIKISKSRQQKQILLDEVSDIYDNFNGRCSDMVKDLYDEMALFKISIKKLKNTRWHNKIEGIVELSTMNHRKAYDLIVPLLQHKNKDVRRTAKIALVELKKAKGLDDLAKLPTEMSDWTSLSIISILHRSPVKLTNTELERLKRADSQSMRSLATHLEKHSLTY